ncbi:MAG: HNH endonuclease [Deltaproteobacteria bacterium]|nr:HNH endonuclease [Deltaproteobacteria bacterium]
MKIHELHQRARDAARKFFRAEAELLDLLQKIDACKGFRNLGHPSLFVYAVDGLKLSESTALNLINVARKAVQIPALKNEIELGNLSVCKARKIVPVLTIQNQAEWIERAKKLPTRKLEKEIARVAPSEAFPERVRYITESRMNLSVNLDEKTMEAIHRVQDLESRRTGRAATLEETFAAMSAFYLEKLDPVAKARRAMAKAEFGSAKSKCLPTKHECSTTEPDGTTTKSEGTTAKSNCTPIESVGATAHTRLEDTDVTVTYTKSDRVKTPDYRKAHIGNIELAYGKTHPKRLPIPAGIEHEVAFRDGSRCRAILPNGARCESRRWLHVHHIKPVSTGGLNSAENLTALCSSHHGMQHDEQNTPAK